MGAFSITLDAVGYTAKPKGKEIPTITRRLQQAGPTELDAAAFCEHVRRGRTWVGGCYAPSGEGWGEYIGMQLFALDIDNSTEVIINGQPLKDAHGHKVKRPLRPGEDGYLDPVDALDRCERLQLAPLCLYFTFSASYPERPRYRIVFDMGEALDQATAEGVAESLLSAFPEADQACSNLNRLYFGSSGEVWECWRCWGGS